MTKLALMQTCGLTLAIVNSRSFEVSAGFLKPSLENRGLVELLDEVVDLADVSRLVT